MRKKTLVGVCATLALAALLHPGPAPAQVGGGLRDRVGNRPPVESRDRVWSRDRGRSWNRGRTWDGRSRDRVRFRGSFGLWVGPGWDPWWWGSPWYPDYPYSYRYPYAYGYPYRPYYPYDYQPPVVVQPPPDYDEALPEPPEDASYWYRCEDPAGYYPYVRDCPGGWTRVPHSPESAQPEPPAPGEPPAAQSQAPAQTAEPGSVPEEYRWYHCADPEGYYPYVRDCPGGWNAVSPSPDAAR